MEMPRLYVEMVATTIDEHGRPGYAVVLSDGSFQIMVPIDPISYQRLSSFLFYDGAPAEDPKLLENPPSKQDGQKDQKEEPEVSLSEDALGESEPEQI